MNALLSASDVFRLKNITDILVNADAITKEEQLDLLTKSGLSKSPEANEWTDAEGSKYIFE